MHDDSYGAPDYGLIAPISVPEDSRVPDEVTGIATGAEYDRYFRLHRDSIDLVDWTRACLTVNQEIAQDLEESSLTEDDKRAILTGLVTVQDITLSHWLNLFGSPEDGTP